MVFPGLQLVEPGVVLVSEWRPDPGVQLPPAHEVSTAKGAAARKP
jgi:hypothetical protein